MKTFSVNFGISKTGLTNVGYTLYDVDGNIKQTRINEGVIELGNSGIYRASINISDGDTILWDTGEVSPRYAVEDYKEAAGGYYGAGGIVYYGTPEFLPQEKTKLFELLSLQVELLKGMNENFKNIDEVKNKIKDIEDGIKGMIEALGAILDNFQIDNITKEVTEALNNVLGGDESKITDLGNSIAWIKKKIDLLERIGAKLLNEEELKEILAEEGIIITSNKEGEDVE